MSNRNLIIVGLLSLVTFFTTPTLAQEVGPVSLTQRVAPLDAVPLTAVGPIDLRQVRAEDENRALDGLPPRFAIPHPVKITPATDGVWETLRDGSRLWRLRIGSPGAVSINLAFTRYDMPKGGRLLLYATDNSYSIRPFTDDDVHDHGQLWTPVLLTDEIVVEVTLPASTPDGALTLELTSINYGYRGFGAAERDGDGSPRSGSCNVDVICPEGDDWRLDIASVAVISTGGGTFCTGFMVNNTANDLTPYFMTAAHCGINAGNAASLVTYWNYENSTCRVPGSGESGGPGDGTLDQFNTGSTFRTSNSPSDMTLVELSADPDSSWNVAYAGWDRRSIDFSGAIAIHHPNTDEKRISFENDPTTTTTYLQEAQPGDGTHVRVTDWDLGTTEPGSSGSPLFSPDHRVIGQLHGGYASCTSQTSDWYGRFSVSWDSTSMSTYLDPGSTGAETVDTISSAGMSVAPAGDVTHMGIVGGPFTNPTVVYTLTNSSPDPVNYSVELTASFGILLDGGTSPVTGTLPASGGTALVTVTLGLPIDSLGAGVYVETINVNDLTHSTTKARVHTVEVGQTLISVDPETGLEASGELGGPFPGTQIYSVTNERPTSVDVQIDAGAFPWISVAAPLSFTLTTTGDFQDVEVGIDAAEAASLGLGVYNGSVSFTNLTSGNGDTSRPVTLEVGSMVYTPGDVPQPINDNSTITSEIEVTEDFCIGDVDVEMDITHTYIGDLIVELASPAGTIVRLHNRSGGTAEDIVTTYDEQDGTLPDGPGTLGDFNLTEVQGTWTLTVKDEAGADTGSLNLWKLRISAAGEECPTFEVIHSFPLDADPGWDISGQWAFGTPTGGGGSSGVPDPTTGFTGGSVYGYNLNGDYPDDMPSTEYLTTTALDCTGVTNTRLLFRRWLGVESATFDHANIQVSNNGSTWTPVWDHSGGSMSDGTWALASFDISSVADEQPTVYIRWGMGTTDGSVIYCGWNIDDVEIMGVATAMELCPNGLGDMDGSDDVNGVDIQAFVDCYMGDDPAAFGCACADVHTDGSFLADDITEFVDCLIDGVCP